MSDKNHPSYDHAEWTSRHLFVRMLSDICAAQNVLLGLSSEDWIARLQKDSTTHFIYGYTFPLNDAAVAGVLRDKAATYTLLAEANVPAVPHFLLRLGALRDVSSAATAAQKLTPLPLVIKPNMGQSGGFDVVRCESATELNANLHDLATRHQNLAVSPYITINCEFRVVMLAGEPLLIFSKTRAPQQWRHNLRLNATPELVNDAALAAELTALARRALQVTGANLAAVDIAKTPDGYKIIEINGGVSLASFAAHSPGYEKAARATYTILIQAMFAPAN